MTSFSDVALSIPEDAPKLHDTFEAKYVTQYLEDYVDNHIYNGQFLRSRIQLNTEVLAVQKVDSEWTLWVNGMDTAAPSTRCKKLVVASGLTSSPLMPDIPRSSNDWSDRFLYHQDFGLRSDAILAAKSPYKNITVVGGR